MDTLDEAIEFVNVREKPLAMYVFTGSKSKFEKVSKLTSAGGVCHNDTLIQAGSKSRETCIVYCTSTYSGTPI